MQSGATCKFCWWEFWIFKVVLKVQQPQKCVPISKSTRDSLFSPREMFTRMLWVNICLPNSQTGVVLKVTAGKGGLDQSSVCAPCRAAGQAKAAASSNVGINSLR